MLYSYAKLTHQDFAFFRFSSLGLGNLLIPWARYSIFSEKYGLKKIAPTWTQLRLGTIVRRESDLKDYSNLFSNSEDEIGGFQRILLLTHLNRVPEYKLNYILNQNFHIPKLVIFKGMNIHKPFEDIEKYHSLIRKLLLNISLTQHLTALSFPFKKSISVHIRLGDFSSTSDSSILFSGMPNYRIPLQWYINQISQIRTFIGTDVPVYVFSDGNNSELSNLMRLKNISRLNFGSSLADMLALSNANVLITSGSTFSMWGSFLGRMPVVWHKGQLKQKLYYDNPNFEIETNSHGKITERDLKTIAARLI